MRSMQNTVFALAAVLLSTNAQESHCSMCNEGRVVVDTTRSIPKGGTCGEVNDLVKIMTMEQCQEKERDIIVAGVRCGCRDAKEFPTCGVQQNPAFCTTGLLARANETCECYGFCGKDFVGCKQYPGDRVTATNCDTWAVSGCNYASAIEGPNPFLLCLGLCPDGNSITFPDRIIPSNTVIPDLNNRNSTFPTCREANEYLIESDGLDCTILQSLALYCGCHTSSASSGPALPSAPSDSGANEVPPSPSAPTPPSCTFCPDDQVSRNLVFETPMGFTCADLVDYFNFLPLPLDCKKDNAVSNSTLNKITDFWVDDLEWGTLHDMCQCIIMNGTDDDGDKGVTSGGGANAAQSSDATSARTMVVPSLTALLLLFAGLLTK